MLWPGRKLISPRSFFPLFRQADGTSWRLTLAPVCGGEPLAASWFAQAFCATSFCVHSRLLYWHRLPLAGSGPFSQTLFHSVFFKGSCFALLLDFPLVASGVFG